MRVPPSGRDLGQRPHHEQPLGRARVRQDQAVEVAAESPVSDQVEVEGARRVQVRPLAAEGFLDAAQGGHQLVRPQFRADDDDAVEEGRIVRVGPGGRTPPRGTGDDVHTFAAEPGKRGLQRLAAVGPRPLVIAAQRDDDGGVQIEAAVYFDGGPDVVGFSGARIHDAQSR